MLRWIKELLKKVIPLKQRQKSKEIIFSTYNYFITYPPYQENRYPFGINLVGYAKAEMGLGEGCRLIAKAIEKAKIDFVIADYEKEHNARVSDFELSHKIAEPRFSVNLVQLNADKIMKFRADSGRKFWAYRYNIAHFAWELPEFPEEWKRSCDVFDEIWTPSDFCTESIRKVTEVPVYTMPFGIEVKIEEPRDQEYFGLPNDKFLFLTMFDVNSVLERKNPMATLRAFKEAFHDNDSVGLVIKINDFKKDVNRDFIMREINTEKNIYVVDDVLSRNDVNALIDLSDVFVSLHRSEGFGLVLAESMYLGKPVIATNWSSNVDFMTHENSCPVSYRLIELETDFGIYRKGNTWADPFVSDASCYMKRLYVDKEYYDTISQNAMLTIKKQYSIDRSAKFIKERLEKIGSV